MKLKILCVVGLVTLLCACSMNSLFLAPFGLKSNSTFQIYDAKMQDSLNLKFVNQNEPVFFYTKGSPSDLLYSIENCLYPNANGDTLNGWIMRPKMESNGRTLIFLHGNAGNLVYNYQLSEPFVLRGYKVFLVDYSEFGFSQGNATRKNLLVDANSSIDYLISREEFKSEKIILYGQSLGAHLTGAIGNQNESKIDGVVIEGGFSSHDDIAANRASFLGRWFVKEQYSAKDSISLIDKPVLIIHSVSDKTIPFKQGKLLYDMAKEPKEFYQIDSAHIRGPLYYADSIDAKMRRLF